MARTEKAVRSTHIAPTSTGPSAQRSAARRLPETMADGAFAPPRALAWRAIAAGLWPSCQVSASSRLL